AHRQQRPRLLLVLSLRVVGEALPVDDDAWLLADGPRVMAWRDYREVSGPELHLFAVVHDDLHPSPDEIAQVGSLAAVSLGDRLDVLGPLPPRLECRATDSPAIKVDQFELAHPVLKRPGLFGRIETLAHHSSHIGASL